MNSAQGFIFTNVFIASSSAAQKVLKHNFIQILILSRKIITIKMAKLALKTIFIAIYTSVPPRSPDVVEIEGRNSDFIIIKWYIVNIFYCKCFFPTESIKIHEWIASDFPQNIESTESEKKFWNLHLKVERMAVESVRNFMQET